MNDEDKKGIFPIYEAVVDHSNLEMTKLFIDYANEKKLY